MHWYLHVWKNAFHFKGRARRKEYWMFMLINLVINIIAQGLFVLTQDPVISIVIGLYGLLLVIPYLAVSVRRLHDTGRSGWVLLFFILAPLTTVAVFMVATILLAKDPQPNTTLLLGLGALHVIVQTVALMWLLVVMVLNSEPGSNRYGPNPKEEWEISGIGRGPELAAAHAADNFADR